MTDNGSKNLCSHCQYPLEGLSDTGRCPECGNPFGGDVIVLWNTDDDRSQTKMMLVVDIIGIASSALTILTASRWIWRVASVIPVCITTFIVWKLWPARNGSQLRISPEGVGNRPGFGPVQLYKWERVEKLLLRKSEGGLYICSIKLNRGRRFGLRFRYTQTEAKTLAERIQNISGKAVELKH